MAVFSCYPADPRVRREAEVLAKAGIEVDIVCLRSKGEQALEAYGGITAHRIMGWPERTESLFRYFTTSTLFGVLSFLKLMSLTLRHRYNLIQVHNMPDHLVFVGLLHRMAGVPVILDLHDLTVELYESRTRGSVMAALLPFVKAAEKLSCAFADKVLTTSPGFRQRLIERGVDPGKIVLVFNSADNAIFSAPPAREWRKIEDGPALLYHGTVARRFGLHVAVEAVSILRKRLPNTRLSIYGKYDPSYREELEELIRERSLSEHVRLYGYLPLDKVSETIGASDMGVVPYIDDPFMRLALSTKIFEYVCMRMPVVASRLESIMSVFGEDGIKYFNPGDPEDLALRIEESCKDPGERKGFTERAARSYDAVAWPVMSEVYLGAVNGLMGGTAKHGP
ncbi:glycosyltransferase family 4 protein [bacterium]|nr:glycosyltransferase family 4 protein [bacterium]